MRKLLALLVCLPALVVPAVASSAPQWTKVSSPHFVVLTDSSEKQGRKIAGQFERMRSLFETLLPKADIGGDPIIVLAFRDRNGFRSAEPAAYLPKGKADIAGLFLSAQDRNYILVRLDAQGDNPYATIYHEYTHFITRKAPWVPLWLVEGLAEFYENTEINGNAVRFGQPSAAQLRFLREQPLLPLPTLFTVDHNSPHYHDEDKTSTFYAESWALTHLLMINDRLHGSQRIHDYLLRLVQHEDPVLAAQHAFGDLNQLQISLRNYVAGNEQMALAMNSGFTVDESSFAASPISATVADAFRADVLSSVGRIPEATTLAEEVLKADPANGVAHETLGAIAYRSHDLAEARKQYAEAVRLNSTGFFARFNFASLSLMDGPRDNPGVEASLRQCIDHDPGFAPAYHALAEYLAMNNRDLDQAHQLSLQAVQLAPENLDFRLTAATILSQQNNIDSAFAVLLEAQKHTRNTAEAEEVRSRVAQLTQRREMVARYGPSQISAQGNVLITETSSLPALAAEPQRVYPAPSASAPHRTLSGILRNVRCSYPSVLTLSLENDGKQVPLFAPDLYKIAFSTSGYIAKTDINPCTAINGMKANIEYAEVKDDDLAGQLVSIQLSE